MLELIEINESKLDPEFAKFYYKTYGIGYYKEFNTNKEDLESIRLYNRVCAVPIYIDEDGNWNIDNDRLGKPNCYFACPIAGRPQTYSLGERWDITVIFEDELITIESSDLQKQNSIKKAISRIMKLIDISTDE